MGSSGIKSVEHKTERYLAQNGGRPLTTRQQRQLRRTKTRIGGQGRHEGLREKQRSRRERFREWMKGMY